MSGNLSQDEINMLLGKQAAAKEGEATPDASMMSQEEIDALMAAPRQRVPSASRPSSSEAAATDVPMETLVERNRAQGGTIEPSEVETLMKGSGPPSGSVFPEEIMKAPGQEQVDALIEQGVDSIDHAVASKSRRDRPKGEGLDQDSIDALISQKDGQKGWNPYHHNNMLNSRQEAVALEDGEAVMPTSMDQEQIDALMANASSQPQAPGNRTSRPSAPRGARMEQTDIDSLFAGQVTDEARAEVPSPPEGARETAEPSFHLEPPSHADAMDQAEVDALFTQGQAVEPSTPVPQPPPANLDHRQQMSQDDIDSMISPSAARPAQKKDNKGQVNPSQPAGADFGAHLDQGAIDALIQQNAAQPPQAAPPAGDSVNLDQSQIDALMAQAQPAQPAQPAMPVAGAQLDQSAIDALIQQNAAQPPQAAPPAGDSVNLDQSQIDALMAQAQPAQPAQPSMPIAGAQLDQGAIDALIQQNAAQPPQAAPPAGDSVNLDQSQIDALMAQTQPAQPAQPAMPVAGAHLDQGAIDALIAQKTGRTAPAASPGPLEPTWDPTQLDAFIAQPSAPVETDSTDSQLDQGAIDALIASQGAPGATAPATARPQPPFSPPVPAPRVPAPPPKPRPRPLPNALRAETINLAELGGKKCIRTWPNRQVTGIHQGAVYLPEEIGKRDSALNAIQRLFSLAGVFREATDAQHYREIAHVTNRYGFPAHIQLSKNKSQPIRVKMTGIPTFNVETKHGNTERTYDVDQFTPNSGSTAKRWVHWFSTQFDRTTLQELSQLRG